MLKFISGFVVGFATLFVLMLIFGDYEEAPTVETVAAAPVPTPLPPMTPAALLGYSAPDIIHEFRMAGLPLGEVVEYTAESDPNALLGRPHQYIQKISWKDTRIQETGDPGTETGGTVEVFATALDMEARKAYVEGAAQSAAFLTQYSFGKGTVLVRLSRALTPDQASAYEDVLLNLPPR